MYILKAISWKGFHKLIQGEGGKKDERKSGVSFAFSAKF